MLLSGLIVSFALKFLCSLVCTGSNKDIIFYRNGAMSSWLACGVMPIGPWLWYTPSILQGYLSGSLTTSPTKTCRKCASALRSLCTRPGACVVSLLSVSSWSSLIQTWGCWWPGADESAPGHQQLHGWAIHGCYMLTLWYSMEDQNLTFVSEIWRRVRKIG